MKNNEYKVLIGVYADDKKPVTAEFRVDAKDISEIGRATQGVTLFKVSPNEKVVAMEMVPGSYGDDEGEEDTDEEDAKVEESEEGDV